jgi:curved DNA-binding protein CbpA
MATLYDVLGARPDDDAENLKKAYREAAKANHPDRHAGDPDAALRFRQIAAAYDVLRDVVQRSAYDGLLEIQRKPLRSKLKHAAAEVSRYIVYDMVAAAAVTALLIAGYTVISGTSAEDEAGVTAAEPAQTVAARLAVRDPAAHDPAAVPQMPIVVPLMLGVGVSAAYDRGALEQTKGDPASDSAGLMAAMAGRDGDQDGLISPTVAAGGTGDSAAEKQGGAQRAPSSRPSWSRPSWSSASWSRAFRSHAEASGERYDPRTSEPAGANAGDGRSAAAKRHPASRPVEQAGLENRHGDIPPLFGVGF